MGRTAARVFPPIALLLFYNTTHPFPPSPGLNDILEFSFSHTPDWSAFVLADAVIEKFGADSIDELVRNWKAFRDRTAARFAPR